MEILLIAGLLLLWGKSKPTATSAAVSPSMAHAPVNTDAPVIKIPANAPGDLIAQAQHVAAIGVPTAAQLGLTVSSVQTPIGTQWRITSPANIPYTSPLVHAVFQLPDGNYGRVEPQSVGQMVTVANPNLNRYNPVDPKIVLSPAQLDISPTEAIAGTLAELPVGSFVSIQPSQAPYTGDRYQYNIGGKPTQG